MSRNTDGLYFPAAALREPLQQRNCKVAVSSGVQRGTLSKWASHQLQRQADSTLPLCLGPTGEETLVLQQQQMQNCRGLGGIQHRSAHREGAGVQQQQCSGHLTQLQQQQPRTATSVRLRNGKGNEPIANLFDISSSADAANNDAASEIRRCLKTATGGHAKAVASPLPSGLVPLGTAQYNQPEASGSSDRNNSHRFSISSNRSFSSSSSVSSSCSVNSYNQQQLKQSNGHGVRCAAGSRLTTVATPRLHTRMQSTNPASAVEEESRFFQLEGFPSAPAAAIPGAVTGSSTSATSPVAFPALSSTGQLEALATMYTSLPPDSSALLQHPVMQQQNRSNCHSCASAPNGDVVDSVFTTGLSNAAQATLAAAAAAVPTARSTLDAQPNASVAVSQSFPLQSVRNAALLPPQQVQQALLQATAAADRFKRLDLSAEQQYQQKHLPEYCAVPHLHQEALRGASQIAQQQTQVLRPCLLLKVLMQQPQADPWLQQLDLWKQLQQQPQAPAAFLKKQENQRQAIGVWQQQHAGATACPMTHLSLSERTRITEQQERQQRQKHFNEELLAHLQQAKGTVPWQQQMNSGEVDWKQQQQQQCTASAQQQQPDAQELLQYQHQQADTSLYHEQGRKRLLQEDDNQRKDSAAGGCHLPRARSIWTYSPHAPAIPTHTEAAAAGAMGKAFGATESAATELPAACLGFVSSPAPVAAAAAASVWMETMPHVNTISLEKCFVHSRTAEVIGSFNRSTTRSSNCGRVTLRDKEGSGLYPEAAHSCQVCTAATRVNTQLEANSCSPPASGEAAKATQKTAAPRRQATASVTAAAAAASLCSTALTVTSSAAVLPCSSSAKAKEEPPSTHFRVVASSATAAAAAEADSGRRTREEGEAEAQGARVNPTTRTAPEKTAEAVAPVAVIVTEDQMCRNPLIKTESCMATGVAVRSTGKAEETFAANESCSSRNVSAVPAEQPQREAAVEPENAAGISIEAGTRPPLKAAIFASKDAAALSARQSGASAVAKASIAAAAQAATAAEGGGLTVGAKADTFSSAPSWIAGRAAARAATSPLPQVEGHTSAPSEVVAKLEAPIPVHSSSKHSAAGGLPVVTLISAMNSSAAPAAPIAATTAGAAAVPSKGASVVEGSNEATKTLSGGSCPLPLTSPQQQQKQLKKQQQQQQQQPKKQPLKQQQSLEQQPHLSRQEWQSQTQQQTNKNVSPLQCSLLADNCSKGGMGHYFFGGTLGEGTFGKVKLGVHAATQEAVAVKILDKQKIQEANDVERVMREIHILKTLRHPHIVQLLEIIETQRHLYLVMEYASGGELYDYIVQRQQVDERQACCFFRQILAGVEEMHKLRICHRDLKPENILLDESKNIKIVDFGLSNTYSHSGSLLTTACGSPSYAAPEMIEGKAYHPLMVDLWSCG